MTTLAALWRAKWVLIVLVAVGAVWLLVTQWLDYRDETARITLPVKAVQTRAAARWKTQVVPGCPRVVEVLPPPKDRARLEGDFGVNLGGSKNVPPGATGAPQAGDLTAPGPDTTPAGSGGTTDPGASHVLGLFEVPRMPDGGEALATLPADGRLDLRFKRNPPPFLGLRPGWEVGGVVDPGQPAADFRVWAAVEPVRMRRWHLRGEASFDRRPGLEDDLRLLVGAVWRKPGS